MAYYSKTLENISNISLPDYRGRDKQYSECVSVAYATTIGPTSVVPSTSCVPGSSGSISLPNLAPIQSQELEPHVIAVTPEDQSEREGESGAFFGQREQDRKVRREIANSNERRRMQSINAGFKSLKTILPHADGDKLSKAAILQQTAEYIFQLESDKLKLLDQNEKLRRSCAECSSPKHRAFLTDISEKDEGIGSPREEDLEDLRRDTIEVRQQLDKERRLRMVLEEKVRELEAKVYPEKLRELANSIAAQYKHNHPKQEDVTSHRPTLPGTASDVQCQVFDASTYGKAAQVPVTTCLHQQPVQQTSNNTHTQKVLYPLATVPATPAVHLSPVQTDTVPAAAMCVSVPGTPEADMKSPTLPPAKNQSAIHRSRQPLKKRAIEVSDIEPKPKVSKVSNIAQTSVDPMSSPISSPGEQQIGIVVPTASVITTKASVPHPTHRQLAKKQQASPLYSLHHPLLSQKVPDQMMQQPQTIQLAIHDNVKLDSAQPVPSPTHKYMTLSSIERLPQYAVQSVPQQQAPAPTGIPAQLPGVIQSFHLAQSIGTKPEEMTLNQLNSVPSLSMTLTQLNAVPNVARSKAAMMAPVAAPQLAPRVQSQFLPLVTMDSILGRHSERRISTATTDSATSDEDLPTAKLPNPAAVEQLEPPCKTTVRTSSTNSDSHPTEVTTLPSSSVAAATTLSVLSSGPGSPPVIRHIDAVTTRRNLETIVQAIDHLEQQERRNSQDNPACIEDDSAPR